MKYYRKFCQAMVFLLWLFMAAYCLYALFTNHDARMIIGSLSIGAIVLHIILTGFNVIHRHKE